MGGVIRRTLDGLYLWSGYLAGAFLVAIFLMMLLMSIGRELGINVKSGDDIAAWCMAAMAFLGLAHTFRSGELIRMGLLVEKLEGGKRLLLESTALLLGIAIAGFLAWHAVWLCIDSWRVNDLSTGVLVIPLWIPQLGFAVGTVVLLVAMLDELVHVLGGGFPHHSKPPPRTREEVIERAASGSH
jgi:TRAP-type C4-dicarboxylate transport system permease small subunit